MRAAGGRPPLCPAERQQLPWAVSAEPESQVTEKPRGPRETRAAPPVPGVTDGSAQPHGRRGGALQPGEGLGITRPPPVPCALGRPHRPHPNLPSGELCARLGATARSLLTTLMSAFDGRGSGGTGKGRGRARRGEADSGEPASSGPGGCSRPPASAPGRPLGRCQPWL